MLKKGEHIEGIPAELLVLLDGDAEANTFLKACQNRTNRVIVTG